MAVGGLACLVDTAVRVGLGGHGLALPLARGLDVQGGDLGGQVVGNSLGPLLGERLVVSVVGDVVVAMASTWVLVDPRVHSEPAIAMPGVHGSFTPAETEVPLLVTEA